VWQQFCRERSKRARSVRVSERSMEFHRSNASSPSSSMPTPIATEPKKPASWWIKERREKDEGIEFQFVSHLSATLKP